MRLSSAKDPIASLILHLGRFISLSDKEKELLSSSVRIAEIKNKEFILQEGKVCATNYFIVQGCFRMYINTSYGTEQIVQFGIDNWWIADYTSFELQKPSDRFIQAVEKSIVVAIDRQQQEDLLSQIPQLERYFRIVFQRAYSAQLNRIHFMLNFSGEERYHHFFNAFPDFVQRVPQYMLASYLGFTPEFLSKVRAKKG